MDNDNLSAENNSEKCLSAFVIDLDVSKSSVKPKPKLRSRNDIQKKNLTKEDLEKKQERALERKQNLQKAKIARILERSEECRRVDEKVQVLLQQDALRRQLPGSETIKPLSKSQLAKTIKDVAHDMENMSLKNKDITKDL